MRTPPTSRDVSQAMNLLCDAFGKKIEQEERRARVWLRVFHWTSGQTLIEAANQLIVEEDYFPSVAKMTTYVHRAECKKRTLRTADDDQSQPQTCEACHSVELYDRVFLVPVRPVNQQELRNAEMRALIPTKEVTRFWPLHYSDCPLREKDERCIQREGPYLAAASSYGGRYDD